MVRVKVKSGRSKSKAEVVAVGGEGCGGWVGGGCFAAPDRPVADAGSEPLVVTVSSEREMVVKDQKPEGADVAEDAWVVEVIEVRLGEPLSAEARDEIERGAAEIRAAAARENSIEEQSVAGQPLGFGWTR